MNRRRAIAWAGAIAMTGCAGVLACNALVCGFDQGSSVVEPPVVSTKPVPGGDQRLGDGQGPGRG